MCFVFLRLNLRTLGSDPQLEALDDRNCTPAFVCSNFSSRQVAAAGSHDASPAPRYRPARSSEGDRFLSKIACLFEVPFSCSTKASAPDVEIAKPEAARILRYAFLTDIFLRTCGYFFSLLLVTLRYRPGNDLWLISERFANFISSLANFGLHSGFSGRDAY